MKEKRTNRQNERKYNNYSQNKSKLTERLRTRNITKQINKSGDKLLIAPNLSDLEQKTNKTQNVMRDISLICVTYLKTGIGCGYCQRWFHFKCEKITEQQASNECPVDQQHV